MLLTEKDKSRLKKFFYDENNELAFKKVIIDAIADSGIDLTIKQTNSIFLGVEAIIKEDEPDTNEIED
jgi:hypothetical protein